MIFPLEKGKKVYSDGSRPKFVDTYIKKPRICSFSNHLDAIDGETSFNCTLLHANMTRGGLGSLARSNPHLSLLTEYGLPVIKRGSNSISALVLN